MPCPEQATLTWEDLLGFFSVGSAGSAEGRARVPWLCGPWTKDVTFLPVPRGLGRHSAFQWLLLIPEGQTDVSEVCVQLAFTPSAGPEPRGLVWGCLPQPKRLGLGLPPSTLQLSRCPRSACGAGAPLSFSLGEGKNLFSKWFEHFSTCVPLSVHPATTCAQQLPFTHPPTVSSLKGSCEDLPQPALESIRPPLPAVFCWVFPATWSHWVENSHSCFLPRKVL